MLAFSLPPNHSSSTIMDPLPPTSPWQKLASLSPRLHRRLSIAKSHTYSIPTPPPLTSIVHPWSIHSPHPRRFSKAVSYIRPGRFPHHLHSRRFVSSVFSLFCARCCIYAYYIIYIYITRIQRSRRYRGNRIPRVLFARSVHAMHRRYIIFVCKEHDDRRIFFVRVASSA